MPRRFPTFRRSARNRSVGRPSIRALTAVLTLGALLLPAVPSVSAASSCQYTFTGNASGTRDVTRSLTSFLASHRGKHLCLKTNGIYRIDGTVRISDSYGLRLDGRNATLRAGASVSASVQRQQLHLESVRNAIVKNLNIRGADPDYTRWKDSRQQEHGIGIYGGDNIRLSHISIRDTYGDGVYVGYDSGRIGPASRITLERLDIARVGRNGVGIVGGHYLMVTDSVISFTGLHSVDLEPNTADAAIHHVTVQRSTMRAYGRAHADTGYAGYAVAVDGWAGEMADINILDNSADRFNAAFVDERGGINHDVVFRGNRSSYPGLVEFKNLRGLTFVGNIRITATKSNVN